MGNQIQILVSAFRVLFQPFCHRHRFCGSKFSRKMTDPAENKTKFSVGFREVQESFYDLVGKLEKTQQKLAAAEEREEQLKEELKKTEDARSETLQQYKEIKSKYVDIKDKLRMVMSMELAPTPAFRKSVADDLIVIEPETPNSPVSESGDAKKKTSASTSRSESRNSQKSRNGST